MKKEIIELFYNGPEGLLNDKKVQDYDWYESYNSLPDYLKYDGVEYEKTHSANDIKLSVEIWGSKSYYKIKEELEIN